VTSGSLGDVIVVGGGPSGLAAAHRLSKAGVPVRVLEAGDQIGGKMRTSYRDGFVVDEGAFFVPTTHRTLLSTAAEIGMVDEILPGRFVLGMVRDGVVHDIDGDHIAGSLARTRLLSTRAKVELVKLVPELMRARRANYWHMPEVGKYDTETLTAWARRRLSSELAEYVAEAMYRGIYSASSETAPYGDFLGILWLLGGAKLVGFKNGMGSYAERLARDVKTEVGAEVRFVESDEDGVDVVWADRGGAEHVDRAAGCVIAIPAQTTVEILPGLDRWRRDFLGRVRNGRLMVVNVGLSQRPRNVESTYILVPRASHPFLAGILLDHHKAPGRAPDGKGLLSLALLDSWCAAHWNDHDDDIRDAALAALEQILPGTIDHVEFAEVRRWRQEFNTVGFYRDLGRFRQLCDEDRRIQLAGDFFSMQNLESATISGQRAAERLLTSSECASTAGPGIEAR